MRIVNRETFMALPAGTLFAKFNPHCFEQIQIKDSDAQPNEDEQGCHNDFYSHGLIEPEARGGSDKLAELLERAIDEGISFPLDFQSTGRDGMFESDQLFAVYEHEDVRALIAELGNVEKCYRT